MADICDKAQDHYEKSMATALEKLSVKANAAEAKQTGYCQACGDPIAKGSANLRFCDVVCRDDYDEELAAKQRRVH